MKKFVEILIEVNGKGSYKLVPFPDEKKKIDVGSVYCSYEKIRRELGWEPKISLKEGLRRTLNYYKKYRQYYW